MFGRCNGCVKAGDTVLQRDDARKEHPSLVPYEDLPESERTYDRNAVMETLKAIAALGYRIEKS